MANPTQAQIDKLTTNLSRYDSIINGAYNETVTLDSHTVKSISGYLAELAANTLRGSWATATAYAIKDIVEESGNWYVCLEAHTSGTFSSDLTADKWALYQINLSGNLDLSGDLTVSGALTVGTVAATTLTGTLSTAAQTNVTSLGTLSALEISGNLVFSGATRTLHNNDNGLVYQAGDDGHVFKTYDGSWLTRLEIKDNGTIFMPGLATNGTDNGTLKYNGTTGEIWVD